MSIGLGCKAVVLTAVILVTVPFVLWFFFGLWGSRVVLVVDK